MQERSSNEIPPDQPIIPLIIPLKNPAAVALGKLGGLKGGKARAQKLSPERRSEIARLGGKARRKNKKLNSNP